MFRPRLFWAQNFKAYGREGGRLPLAPLTLIFGQNNSGKSAILHALLYWADIVTQGLGASGARHRAIEPIAGLELGEFAQFVH
jgi:AAA15 family ATPase/GTPase